VTQAIRDGASEFCSSRIAESIQGLFLEIGWHRGMFLCNLDRNKDDWPEIIFIASNSFNHYSDAENRKEAIQINVDRKESSLVHPSGPAATPRPKTKGDQHCRPSCPTRGATIDSDTLKTAKQPKNTKVRYFL
jgi:hypothetical protein